MKSTLFKHEIRKLYCDLMILYMYSGGLYFSCTTSQSIYCEFPFAFTGQQYTPLLLILDYSFEILMQLMTAYLSWSPFITPTHTHTHNNRIWKGSDNGIRQLCKRHSLRGSWDWRLLDWVYTMSMWGNKNYIHWVVKYFHFYSCLL